MAPIPDDPNQAQAWISGEPPDQTIDFYIPRGNTGQIGPRGPIGPSLAVGSVTTVDEPGDLSVTPDDPSKTQVVISKTLDQLDFEFYVPKTHNQNFAIAMAIAL